MYYETFVTVEIYVHLYTEVFKQLFLKFEFIVYCFGWKIQIGFECNHCEMHGSFEMFYSQGMP